MFGSAFGFDILAGAISQERQMDRDADAADTAWRRGQENTREANAFTERMSNTAHQRAVVDLRSAGLNPILAATKGGASASPGAMAQAPSQAPAPDFSKTFGPAIRSAVENTEMDTRLKDAQRNFTSQQWNTSRATEALTNEQFRTQQELTRYHHHLANSAAEIEKGNKREGEIDEGKWGEFFRYLDRLRGTGGVIRDVKPR